MAKPEWGVKRVCQSCAAKFYDLGRSPISCPKCGAHFDPEALLKSRRSRPAAAPKTVVAAAPAKAAAQGEAESKPAPAKTDLDIAGDEDDEVLADIADDDSDDDDDAVIVDASELGGDDDMSDVRVEKDDES